MDEYTHDSTPCETRRVSDTRERGIHSYDLVTSHSEDQRVAIHDSQSVLPKECSPSFSLPPAWHALFSFVSTSWTLSLSLSLPLRHPFLFHSDFFGNVHLLLSNGVSLVLLLTHSPASLPPFRALSLSTSATFFLCVFCTRPQRPCCHHMYCRCDQIQEKQDHSPCLVFDAAIHSSWHTTSVGRSHASHIPS